MITQYQYSISIHDFFIFVGCVTVVIMESDKEQEIIKGIHAGLGETLQSQPMAGHLGQSKIRKILPKGTIDLECVLTLPIISEPVTDASGQSLSICRKYTMNSRQCTSQTKFGTKYG